MKIIDNCFRRSFLHKVGSKASLKKTTTCDHTTGAARSGTSRFASKPTGETPSCYGEFGLELPKGTRTTSVAAIG